jgi:cytochrome c oxidase subunit II
MWSPQSVLSPAGRDAETILRLFWWMLIPAILIWLVVIGAALYAMLASERAHEPKRTRLLVVGGGAVVPALLLGLLAFFGLRLLPPLLEPGEEAGPRIVVSGEQWWWRVRYELAGGESFELANEIWLPVGRRLSLELQSADVIHSLWVPALGGKVDLIPGRVTRMALEPTRPGVYRGVCAEFCGSSHARMGLVVVVVGAEEFESWTGEQARPAPEPDRAAVRGATLFDALGCGACHAIRGTGADGVLGPDLTHVGSRSSLAAGAMPNDPEGFEQWLAASQRIKPGVHMPAFDMLPDKDRRALAAYLDSLR